MGQVLHGSATTTEAVRRAIQHSQESLRALAQRYGVNPETIAKWGQRSTVSDQRTGPKQPRSVSLSPEEEAIVVAFRRHTQLPLDDCLYALQPSIPTLTRSALHRCLQRHGLSRLPDLDGDKPHKRKFKRYPIGYFHVDIAEVRTEQGKLYLLVAIDRVSKFALVQLHERATTRVAADFLRALLPPCPTPSTPCSPTTARTSPRQAMRRPLPPTSAARSMPASCSALMPSSSPVPRTASTTASPSPGTR